MLLLPLMNINNPDIHPPMELLLLMDINSPLMDINNLLFLLTLQTIMEPHANSVELTLLTLLEGRLVVLQLLGESVCSALYGISVGCLV